MVVDFLRDSEKNLYLLQVPRLLICPKHHKRVTCKLKRRPITPLATKYSGKELTKSIVEILNKKKFNPKTFKTFIFNATGKYAM